MSQVLALGVFLLALSLVHATCSRSPHFSSHPSSSSSSSSSPTPPQECRQLSQREMQTTYIKCFTDRHFEMSINVEVDDYGIFTSRANQVLDGNEFVSAFDVLVRDDCKSDRLQPRNKYWQYICEYNMHRIPQNRWSVECHHDYNPCRNKTITCVCDNTLEGVKETSMCSDGVPRRLDCTGSCTESEESCDTTYTIAQEWREVNVTTMYLELTNGTEFIETCKVTPMEVYLSNTWKLRREQVTVACTCEEQQPIMQL